MWSMLFQAHQGPANTAQHQLLLRYHGAVYRYLVGMLRDPASAEELSQEFAVRFLRGDFKQADPQRGRFRDLLKTAVRHLVINYWRRQEKENRAPLPSDVEGPAPVGLPADLDGPFHANWREELLARTWQSLLDFQEETKQPYHTVLRCKIEHPELRSAQLAEHVAGVLGKSVSAAGVRQTLHRSRDKFAALLVEEVARSLQSDDPAGLEQELIELDLLDYCRSALKQRG
jgi:RNA polymerase sigma-70 factor (ECF subfamily)